MDWLNYPNAAAREAAGLPKTKGCFAKKNHISRSQLWRYEKDFDFQRERLGAIQNLVTADDWKAIMLAQKNNAMCGNLNSAKWLAEQLGFGAKPFQDVPTDENEEEKRLLGMSEDELERYIAEHEDEFEGDD